MEVVVDGIIYQLQHHGGISRIFSETLPRICDVDENVHMLLLTSGPSRQALPTHQHIHHRSIPGVERFLRPAWLWTPIISTSKGICLRPYVGSTKGKIWHSTYYTMPYEWGRFSWEGPQLVTVADMIYEKFPSDFEYAKHFTERKRKCVQQADRVIAISESTKCDILQYLGIPENKVVVIYLAASDFFKELPETDKNKFKEHYRMDRPFLIYVGNRSLYKNFKTLLKAYSLWKRRCDFDLICIGGESAWSKEEVEMITYAGLGNSVKLFTSVKDEELRAFYACAYAFIYPSIYEGFGIPPFEAMACGTPVIVANTSSLPEVVGDAGLYFEPFSEEELINALDRIVDDSNLRNNLVKKGLDRNKAFSWNNTAISTYNLYRDVL